MSLAKSNAMRGGLIYAAVAVLVLGALGWATRAALRLEAAGALADANAHLQKQHRQAVEDWDAKIRLALWRLDARLGPTLAREESRPSAHYSALHSPFPAFEKTGAVAPPGAVFLPSPLLNAELPDWIQLHFQIDPTAGWSSPEVIPPDLRAFLSRPPIGLPLPNATPAREELLRALQTRYPSGTIVPQLQARGVLLPETAAMANGDNPGYYGNNKLQPGPQPALKNAYPQSPLGNSNNDFQQRMNISRGGIEEARNFRSAGRGAAAPYVPAAPHRIDDAALGTMMPVWLPCAEQPEHLAMVRAGHSGPVPVYQGVVIHWTLLRKLLRSEIEDLFEGVEFRALPERQPQHPERALSTLPVELEILDAAPEAPAEVTEAAIGMGTPLRIGLGAAWLSTLIALSAVGLGGRSLLALSERRARFVSAVTHELRTPLTTMRLYLDMLERGMVTDETQRAEYISTLNGEAERLNRLVGNVLDYSKLENRTAPRHRETVIVADFLEMLAVEWRGRCQWLGKELVVETDGPLSLSTDPDLLERILSNLLDNARKYSRGADDPRIWLRAVQRGAAAVSFEVEDCGPGVPKRDRRSIFRPFRRGGDADERAGGAGLGLALASSWTRMLGGKLEYCSKGRGACFAVTIPI